MKKMISLLLAILCVTLCFSACGSETEEESSHDSALVGYWISEECILVDDEKEEPQEDFAGIQGIEIYENGMVRMMERYTITERSKYRYIAESNYSDYMIIGLNQIAFLDQNSNGETVIEVAMDYSVKGDVLTLISYIAGQKTVMTYKRLNTPFYKYFPEISDISGDQT